jgi:hypothetical protein
MVEVVLVVPHLAEGMAEPALMEGQEVLADAAESALQEVGQMVSLETVIPQVRTAQTAERDRTDRTAPELRKNACKLRLTLNPLFFFFPHFRVSLVRMV